MQLFVRTLTGKTLALHALTSSTTIEQIKDKIADKEHLPASIQRLIHQATQLEDAKTLGYYNIKNEATIHLVLRLVAGTNTKTGAESKASTSNAPKKQLLPPVMSNQFLPQPSIFFQPHLQQQQQLGELLKLSQKVEEKKPSSPKKPKIKQEPTEQKQQQQNQEANVVGPTTSTSTTITTSPVPLFEPTTTTTTTTKDIKDSKDIKESKKRVKRTKRGQYTKRACTNCRNAHAACDHGRPCKRCVTLGKEGSCADAERKRTRKRTLGEMENQFYPAMTDYISLLSQIQPYDPSHPSNTAQHAESEEDYDDDEEEYSDEMEDEEMVTSTTITDSAPTSSASFVLPPTAPHADMSTIQQAGVQNALMLFNVQDHDQSRSLIDDDTTTQHQNSEQFFAEITPATSNALELPENMQPHFVLPANASNDGLVHHLLNAYARQAQELKELKELVRHLQNIIISSGSMSPMPALDVANK